MRSLQHSSREVTPEELRKVWDTQISEKFQTRIRELQPKLSQELGRELTLLEVLAICLGTNAIE